MLKRICLLAVMCGLMSAPSFAGSRLGDGEPQERATDDDCGEEDLASQIKALRQEIKEIKEILLRRPVPATSAPATYTPSTPNVDRAYSGKHFING